MAKTELPGDVLIQCENVSLGYEGQTVLSHLNLTIRDGDYLCIVGDNGSGKSTLLRGLLGLPAWFTRSPQRRVRCTSAAPTLSRTTAASCCDVKPAAVLRI